MPSWNIHAAHVESLLSSRGPADLGIADPNVFLFGNYVPDIYLGFMVPDTTFRVDYCLTHLARPHVIPAPDADRFWDECICHPVRRPSDGAGLSLALGTWAHLVADRTYNLRFRAFCEGRDVPEGDELRRRKQADFKVFGDSLHATRLVNVTPELLEAARRFRPYSILPDDVCRAVDVASALVGEADFGARDAGYQLLSAEWMAATFAACDAALRTWLETWVEMSAAGKSCTSADLRARIPSL